MSTVVKLAPDKSVSSVSTFEEAFGEYSNAGGRTKRVQKRAANKVARKTAKAAAKDTIKRTKSEGRIARKMDKRSMKQDARQQRKMTRKMNRIDRRALGQEEELQEQNLPNEQVEQQEQMQEEQFQEQPQAQYSEDAGSEENNQGYSEDSGNSYEEEEGGYEGEDEGGYDESDEEYGFNGNEGNSCFVGESASTAKKKIDPAIKDIATKIEWNKEMIERLNVKRANLQAKSASTSEIDAVINKHRNRINELETKLANFSGADGKNRTGEINAARRFAKRRRGAIRANRSPKNNGGSETPVDRDLNPDLGKQSIKIPATSNATGINALDLAEDLDSPKDRVIELKSNAAGKTAQKAKSNKIVPIVIGVSIAALAIYAIRKYKIFG